MQMRSVIRCSFQNHADLSALQMPYEDLAENLTLIGIVGIEVPLREGVNDAVAMSFKAGVTVKMCTGDNVFTARSIALRCAVFTPGGIIMEGAVFSDLNERRSRAQDRRRRLLGGNFWYRSC